MSGSRSVFAGLNSGGQRTPQCRVLDPKQRIKAQIARQRTITAFGQCGASHTVDQGSLPQPFSITSAALPGQTGHRLDMRNSTRSTRRPFTIKRSSIGWPPCLAVLRRGAKRTRITLMPGPNDTRINFDRFWSTIEKSAEIGKGRPGGLSRLALTDADREVRDQFV